MDFKEIRHHLHSIAEPSGFETKTSAFIIEKLKETQPSKIIRFKTGSHFLCEYDFGEEGKTVLFRADMDAVLVDESEGNLNYRSVNKGVSHKCGHDGHSTILLNMAKKLHEKPLQKGKVLLLFQGAEETGQGANDILNDTVLSRYKIDTAYALHNIPGEEKGAIICKTGSFTCSVVSCEIVLTGKTAHAAEPWNAVSPYPAAEKIAEKVLVFNNFSISADDFCVATLIEFHIGEKAYGVAAGNGVLRFTIRTKTDGRLRGIQEEIERTVREETGKTHGLESGISWTEHFAAAENKEPAVATIRHCAGSLGLKYIEKESPFFWGEDFGLFTQRFDGALFGLGSGTEQPPLHHPDFDFPDDIIETGASMFYEIAKNELC